MMETSDEKRSRFEKVIGPVVGGTEIFAVLSKCVSCDFGVAYRSPDEGWFHAWPSWTKERGTWRLKIHAFEQIGAATFEVHDGGVFDCDGPDPNLQEIAYGLRFAGPDGTYVHGKDRVEIIKTRFKPQRSVCKNCRKAVIFDGWDELRRWRHTRRNKWCKRPLNTGNWEIQDDNGTWKAIE